MIPGEGRETFLNVLNFFTEGQNRTFNKLLGAPSNSLIPSGSDQGHPLLVKVRCNIEDELKQMPEKLK